MCSSCAARVNVLTDGDLYHVIWDPDLIPPDTYTPADYPPTTERKLVPIFGFALISTNILVAGKSNTRRRRPLFYRVYERR